MFDTSIEDDNPDTEEYGLYDAAIEDTESYTTYTLRSNQRSIETYRQIVDEPWLEEPLRELVETRLEEMLER